MHQSCTIDRAMIKSITLNFFPIMKTEMKFYRVAMTITLLQRDWLIRNSHKSFKNM